MYKHYQAWNDLAPRGLVLIGFGAALLGEAIAAKAKRRAGIIWFVLGTLALIVLNAGVAVFGEAVKNRAMYEMKLHQEEAKA
jgi:hypothetical protein